MAKKKPEPISRAEAKKQLAELVKLIQVTPQYKNKLDSKQKQSTDTLHAYRLEIKYLQKLLKDNGIDWDMRKKKK
jgi:hypothetical protein